MKQAKYIRTRILQMTQTELARALNQSQPSISSWEKRGRVPTSALDAIRDLGKQKHGNNWSDSWLYDGLPDDIDEAA